MLEVINTLMMRGIVAEHAEIIAAKLQVGWIEHIMIIAYTVIGSLTVQNIVICVASDVVGSGGEHTKDEVQLRNIHNQVARMIREINVNHDAWMSRDEFQILLASREHIIMLHYDRDVEVEAGEFIFGGVDKIDIKEFKTVIMQSRGSKQATVKDMLDVRMFVHFNVETALKRLEQAMLRRQSDGGSPSPYFDDFDSQTDFRIGSAASFYSRRGCFLSVIQHSEILWDIATGQQLTATSTVVRVVSVVTIVL